MKNMIWSFFVVFLVGATIGGGNFISAAKQEREVRGAILKYEAIAQKEANRENLFKFQINQNRQSINYDEYIKNNGFYRP